MDPVEVFTIGGGEYIVNVFQAVAAWTGGGGYKSMIRVVMVMGLIYALLVTAFNMDWRAMMNWFLQSTLIYLCLMVPTVTVKVTDRVNPSLAPAVIDNVPLGLGMLASFTSQIGDYDLPPRRHNRPCVHPLAPRQILPAIPAVLPLRSESQDHHLRLGERR